MKKLIFIFLLSVVSCSMFADDVSDAKWITVREEGANKPNTWIAFRKDILLTKLPQKALTKIAVDSKYWLWINGELVIFEGGLKRGPNPRDSYYDEIDLAPYLKKGENKIAVLLWYFGKEGFSHKDSGKAGLIFDMDVNGKHVVSDSSWYSSIHPAYSNTEAPFPNWRLSESNIRFYAEKDIKDWQIAKNEKYGFKNSLEIGR